MNQVNMPRQDLRMVGDSGNDFQPLALRSTFWRPAWLQDSPWLEHIPFAFWLVEAHQPRVLVELGTRSATSYFAFCQAVERLGLDTRCHALGEWDGAQGGELLARVQRHNEAQYSSFSRISPCTPAEALARFSDRSIDVLQLDPEGGALDLEAFDAWLPKMSERGVVLIHRPPQGDDAGSGFDALLRGRPHFEFLHGEGLALIGVGSDQGHLLRRLFGATGNDAACKAIHEVFARLGRACADHHAAQTQRERASTLAEQVDRQQKQLDEVRQSLDKTKGDLSNRQKELSEARNRLQTQLEQHAVERGQLAERVNLLQEIRGELKDETARLQSQIEAAQGELGRRTEEIKGLAVEVGEHKTHIAMTRASLETREAELAKSQEGLKRTRNELAEAVKARQAAEEHRIEQVGRLDKRVAELEAHTRQLGDQAAQLHGELETARQSLAERVADLQAVTRHSAETEAQLRRAASDALEASADQERRSAQDLATLKQQLAAEVTAHAQARFALEQAAADTTRDARAMNELRERLQQRDAEIGQLTAGAQLQAADLERSTAAAQAAEAELRSANEALAQVRIELADSSKQVEAGNGDLRAMQAEKAADAEEAARMRAENVSLRDALRQRFEETAALTGMVSEHEHSLRSVRQQHAASAQEAVEQRGRAEQAAADLDAARRALQTATGEAQRVQDETAALRKQLQQREAELARRTDEAAAHAAQARRDRTGLTDAQASLQTRFAEIAQLTGMVAELEQLLAAQRGEMRGEQAALQAEAARLTAELGEARSDADVQRERLQALKLTASWKLTAPLRKAAGIFNRQSKQSPVTRQIKALRESGMFDEAWYLARYEDVGRTRIDAAEHYLRFGAAERRDPGPAFSTSAYLDTYPDVEAAGFNPVLHYIAHGKTEGRIAKASTA